MSVSASQHVANGYMLEMVIEDSTVFPFYDPSDWEVTKTQLDRLTL